MNISTKEKGGRFNGDHHQSEYKFDEICEMCKEYGYCLFDCQHMDTPVTEDIPTTMIYAVAASTTNNKIAIDQVAMKIEKIPERSAIESKKMDDQAFAITKTKLCANATNKNAEALAKNTDEK